MTIDFNYAIKNKLINKLKLLIPQAYDLAPTELENLICHGELILRQDYEKKVKHEMEYEKERAMQNKAKQQKISEQLAEPDSPMSPSPNSTLKT